MSKRCPSCGLKESDDARVCHICGGPLVEEKDDDFEFDFGSRAESRSNSYDVFDLNAESREHGTHTDESHVFELHDFEQNGQPQGVQTKLGDGKANKMKRNIFSLSSALIVICFVRFIFVFISLSDVNEIRDMLSSGYVWDDELVSILNTFVNTYYCAIVVLALFLVASIVLAVFAFKVNKHSFPLQNDGIFADSKKAFFASIPTVALVIAYFVTEVISLITDLQLQNYLEEYTIDSQTLGALIVDIVLVVSAFTCMFSALQLSKSKVNNGSNL